MLEEHIDRVDSVTFSPDGSFLASGRVTKRCGFGGRGSMAGIAGIAEGAEGTLITLKVRCSQRGFGAFSDSNGGED